MSVKAANVLLEEGIAMLEQSEREQKSLKYIQEAMGKLREAGKLVYQKYPNLIDMISYANTHVPKKHHHNINHAWSGIGDWDA